MAAGQNVESMETGKLCTEQTRYVTYRNIQVHDYEYEYRVPSTEYCISVN